jgi:hypothetical protein
MSDEYLKLLDEVRPRAINDEAEAERVRAELDRLRALHTARSDAMDEMTGLLSTLLMAYEQQLKWDQEWEQESQRRLRRALDKGDASGVFEGDATDSVLEETGLDADPAPTE